MEALELKVDGMTCGSCVKAATRALSAVPGVDSVDVRLTDGAATVRGDQLAGRVHALLAALSAAGYDAHVAQTATRPALTPAARGGCGSGRAAGGGCCCSH
jgi:copper chaperone